MVQSLTESGYINQVYVPTYDKTVSVIQPDSNVIVSECFKKWDRIAFDYKQKKIIKDIQRKIDMFSFDCIHAYTLFTDGNCAMRLSKKYGIPYVVAVRNTDVNDFLRLMVHLRSRGVAIMRNASAVIFLSESYRRYVFEKYIPIKYREELLKKTYVIPNGIDNFWFDNIPQTFAEKCKSEKIRLIYAGRIDKNKNIPTTQAAMKILRAKGYDIKLTVVGKVSDKKEFAKIRKDENTVCMPHKVKEELIQLYRNNDIFVMPSFTESFGLVYVEAMSQGLPVLYSEGQGFDTQFPEGQVGFHVCSHSPQSVANGILKIVSNYNTIASQAMTGSSQFVWKKIAQLYKGIYHKTGCKKL